MRVTVRKSQNDVVDSKPIERRKADDEEYAGREENAPARWNVNEAETGGERRPQ